MVFSPATQHALSPLDQAHAHRLDGDEEAALRLAIACAAAAPDAPGPMALIARILVDEERSFPVDLVARRLVEAFVRRGDLSSAVVASTIDYLTILVFITHILLCAPIYAI